MFCVVKTAAVLGIEAEVVEVQVSLAGGMPSFVIVGQPDKAVNESRERVRAVFDALGATFPQERIIVNLTPADIIKEGAHYDLPIAVALMAAAGILEAEKLKPYLFMGALSLSGAIEKVSGVLPAAMTASREGLGIVCSYDNGGEAAWSGNERILAPRHIIELIKFFTGAGEIKAPVKTAAKEAHYDVDMADVKGQESAKRAMLIAAAGGHNVLMSGPPGSGKTMLAERLVTILPKMTAKEALELAMVRSAAGIFGDGIDFKRPFRAPHHSASTPALVGGGRKGVPGEISLAHNGVLFLDELPEFTRSALEALRQPLESRKAVIARVAAHTEYPAAFQLMGAMNPCRCGYFGTKGRECPRAPKCAADYMAKLSGPMLDRFDMRIDVPAVSPYELTSGESGADSATLLRSVEDVRAICAERLDRIGVDTGLRNADLKGEILEKILEMDKNLRLFAAEMAEKCGLTGRSLMRILRLARTIADLQNEKKVSKMHLMEALSYRHRLLHKT